MVTIGSLKYLDCAPRVYSDILPRISPSIRLICSRIPCSSGLASSVSVPSGSTAVFNRRDNCGSTVSSACSEYNWRKSIWSCKSVKNLSIALTVCRTRLILANSWPFSTAPISTRFSAGSIFSNCGTGMPPLSRNAEAPSAVSSSAR